MARQFGNKQKPENAGEVRQSQLITTFGIGSIVDFVRDTVIIGGLDKWDRDDLSDDWEDRKLFNNNLQALTGTDFFLAPKTANNNRFRKSNDVESFVFPRKLYCPICKHIIDAGELGNQQKKHNCFVPNPEKGGKPCGGHLVASRFVLACPNGHVEDFPYSWWVHHGNNCKSGKANPQLKMFNIDNRSDVDSLMIECEECHAIRGMANAFARNAFSGENGYHCSGHHPHLGTNYHSECTETVSARLRSSSSVYFSANISALSIPPWSKRAVQAIKTAFEGIQEMEEFGDVAVRKYIKKQVLPKVSEPITFEDLLSAYKLVKDKKASSEMLNEADVFAAEYDVLCRGNISADEYVASEASIPAAFKKVFESITIVEKLTVISALVGFTRMEPWDGRIKDNPRLAPLSSEKKKWLPAVKLLGEGIFIKFNAKTLDDWCIAVNDRYSQMTHEFENSFFTNERFSPEYVAMHTFAHLFIRQLAEDCGYSASSLKEKIYSTFNEGTNQTKMHGVLIYISSTDAEGTPLLVYEKQRIIPAVYDKGTIVIEKFLRRETESGRRRFTISHEGAHFVMDRTVPQASFHREYDNQCIYTPAELKNLFNFKETQIDRMGAALLMPRFMVRNVAEAFGVSNGIPIYGDNILRVADHLLIQEMANAMGASFAAFLIRFRELGLLQRYDISEYITDEMGLGKAGDVK